MPNAVVPDVDEPSLSISSMVKRNALALGITLPHLLLMVQHSSRITHEKGNRRYYGYLFKVVDNNVVGFWRLDGVPIVVPMDDRPDEFHKCEKCQDTHHVLVYDICPRCDGSGCDYCDAGSIPTSIPCPECRKKT